MIDKDFEESGDNIVDEVKNVIITMAIMHEIKEISILYTQSMLADCLSKSD